MACSRSRASRVTKPRSMSAFLSERRSSRGAHSTSSRAGPHSGPRGAWRSVSRSHLARTPSRSRLRFVALRSRAGSRRPSSSVPHRATRTTASSASSRSTSSRVMRAAARAAARTVSPSTSFSSIVVIMGRFAPLLAVAFLVASCGEVTRVAATRTPASATSASAIPQVPATGRASATAAPTTTSITLPTPCRAETVCAPIQAALDQLSVAKMNDHLAALTAVGSRDPRNPGHAKAVAYIKEQLSANTYLGWKIESQRTVYQGIPLENIFATIDLHGAPRFGQATPVGDTGWILISAHYDSTANRTPGWRPAIDPAPGADDNATGTAALLEFQRVLSQ